VSAPVVVKVTVQNPALFTYAPAVVQFVVPAATAGSGVSSAIKPDVISEARATNAIPLLSTSRNPRKILANI
jgi:hypothetical protein